MWRRFALAGGAAATLGSAWWYSSVSSSGPIHMKPKGVPLPVSSAPVLKRNPALHAGVYAIQGRREYMEDTHILLNPLEKVLQTSGKGIEQIDAIITEVNNLDPAQARRAKANQKPRCLDALHRGALFAVFDGHGGPVTSSFAAAFFPYIYTETVVKGMKLLLEKQSDAKDINAVNHPNLLSDALHITHVRLMRSPYAKRKSPQDGSTAIVCVFNDGNLITANVGDSRAVLGHSTGSVDLSNDHKPDDPKELKRIVAAGGAVELDRFGTPRIFYANSARGGLALSRALGDDFYKPPGRIPLVPVDPEVTVHPLQPGTDKFVIIASDGLWDVLSSADAVKVTKKLMSLPEIQRLPTQADRMNAVAKRLVLTAYEQGSMDNITAIVVQFDFDYAHENQVAEVA